MVGLVNELPPQVSNAFSWWEFFKSIPVLDYWWVIPVAIVIWAIGGKDSFDRFRLFLFSIVPFYKWIRRRIVKGKFETVIYQESKKLMEEIGQDVIPFEPHINWVKDLSKDAFIKKNKVVLRLNYHDDNSRTLVAATLGFVRQGLLTSAKQYLPEEILESSNLLVTKRLVEKLDSNALNYLHTEILIPLFKEKPEVKEKFDDLVALDNNSMFTQILLPELIEMGNLLFPRIEKTGLLYEEVTGLINFLHRIATREKDEEVPLEYRTRLFSLLVVIVAKDEKIAIQGTQPYIKAVNIGLRQGIKNIYLLSRGHKRKDAERIASHFKGQDSVASVSLRKGTYLHPEDLQIIDCLCVQIRSKQMIPARRSYA
jgi:hypothetical protein